MHQIQFWLGPRPRPRWGAYSAPQSLWLMERGLDAPPKNHSRPLPFRHRFWLCSSGNLFKKPCFWWHFTLDMCKRVTLKSSRGLWRLWRLRPWFFALRQWWRLQGHPAKPAPVHQKKMPLYTWPVGAFANEGAAERTTLKCLMCNGICLIRDPTVASKVARIATQRFHDLIKTWIRDPGIRSRSLTRNVFQTGRRRVRI